MIDPLDGGPSAKAAKITNWDGLFTYSPTISQNANRLAVMKTHIRENIYVGELEDGGTRLAFPKRLTVSESLDFSSGWMRDGKTILFDSNRTGRSQVFRQQLGQDTPERLMMGPDDEGDAELSPDGLWILYWSSTRDGDSPAVVKRLMRFPAGGDILNRFWKFAILTPPSTVLFAQPVPA